ncbi:hypothetical protein QT970_30135, partial [Microcoleus sp. herbarium8]|uniref:hypothetical protein n=1 Tax=Microcoleus sp. herbarium8 TaxID=3055436 RepID=UPI002FD4214A
MKPHLYKQFPPARTEESITSSRISVDTVIVYTRAIVLEIITVLYQFHKVALDITPPTPPY